MEMQPTLQLTAAIKALKDVVLPALDPAHRLAQEQGGLVVSMLELLAARLPLLYRYERDELVRFVELAADLAQAGAGQPGLEALRQGEAAGREVLARARAEPAELAQASLRLREATGALVAAVHRGPETPARQAVDRHVMAHAREQLLRERAFVAPQRWEGEHPALPSLASLLPPIP